MRINRTAPMEGETKMRTIALVVLALMTPGLLRAEQSGGEREWTLEEALPHALSGNLELQQARQKVEIAKAQWIEAKTFPFNPELDVESASDSRYNNEGERRQRTGISQELEVFGQRWSRKRAAQYRWDAARAEYESAEKSLVARLRESFFNQLFLQKRRETLAAVLEFDKEIWDAAQKRFKEGMIRQLDLDLTRIEYSRSRSRVLRAESDWAAGRLRFNRLMGFSNPLQETRLKGDLRFPPLDMSVERMIALALKSRGDYRAAVLETRASKEDLSSARRRRFPNPKLGVFLEKDQGEIEGLRDNDKLLGFSLAFPLPIFNRNQGEVARATAGERLAGLLQNGLELDVKASVAAAYRRLKALEEVLDAYAELEGRLDQDLTLVRGAYVMGQIPIESYLTQKDRFVGAKIDLLEAFQDYIAARSATEQAVNMNWEELVRAAEGDKK